MRNWNKGSEGTHINDREHEPSCADGLQAPRATQPCACTGLALIDVFDAIDGKDDEDGEDEA